jgi:hypothetical protein
MVKIKINCDTGRYITLGTFLDPWASVSHNLGFGAFWVHQQSLKKEKNSVKKGTEEGAVLFFEVHTLYSST